MDSTAAVTTYVRADSRQLRRVEESRGGAEVPRATARTWPTTSSRSPRRWACSRTAARARAASVLALVIVLAQVHGLVLALALALALLLEH